MTEGGAIKTKRNGARIFKNPPQPHMCIQDYMQGSDLPCYVNVLSWDKVAKHCSLYQNVPLYGGMRVSPPRGEKAEVGVFAVIANPELLKLYGKNCQDDKEQATLIEALLDFVETKNEGVYFSRQYVILKDKDITGELKEVWMAVQAKRDRENLQPQQETWIDAQPMTPQYPQYSDQQTHHQQLQTPPPQQQHVEYAHPPQYQTKADYFIGRVPNNEIVNHEREIRYNYQQQNQIVTQSEPFYYNSQDRCYNYRERCRPNVQQNPTQQNCPAYPAPQYQYQQLPRQMVPQYVNSNMHINPNPNSNMANQDYKMNVNFSSKFYELTGSQQQSPAVINVLQIDRQRRRNKMQQQQPQQQMQQQVQQQQQMQQQQQQMQQQVQQQQQIQQQQIQHQIQQQHQIQMQQHQIQEQQQQFINYQQQANQHYQRQTPQMQQSQNQSQPENHIDVGDKRIMRKPCYYNGESSPKSSVRLQSDMRKWSNKQDLTDCEINDASKRRRVPWFHGTNPRKMKNQSLDIRYDGEKVSQTKGDSTINSNDQEEDYHQAYTILKKPEVLTTTTTTTSSVESNIPKSSGLENEIEKKLAQISIEDCKDATEVNVVLS